MASGRVGVTTPYSLPDHRLLITSPTAQPPPPPKSPALTHTKDCVNDFLMTPSKQTRFTQGREGWGCRRYESMTCCQTNWSGCLCTHVLIARRVGHWYNLQRGKEISLSVMFLHICRNSVKLH